MSLGLDRLLGPALMALLGVAALALAAAGGAFAGGTRGGWVVWGVAAAVAVVGLAWRERSRLAALRRRTEELRRLHEAQKMEAVGRLAGGLAHDINNYLATIRAHCELVLAKQVPRPALEEKMRIVIATVLRASSLVERLLTFARRQPTTPERVDLGELVEVFAAMAAGTLGERRLDLRLADELWSVEGDLAELEQVVANLVVNAVDATRADGTVRIETRNVAAGSATSGGRRAAVDQVALVVADDGAGIAAELQPKLFEPFFTTKEGRGSSGLGLATVDAIVRDAGGVVELASAPGAGAVFTVLLPRAPARGTMVPVSRPATRPPQRGAPPPGGGERILLVEDDAALRDATATLLRSLGYAVATAGDADGALLAAAHEEPALVVADVQLGAGTGVDLVRRLREKWPVRALYMSGYTDRIALRGGPGQGDAFFLKKPFSAEGLARMVRELLDGPPPASAASSSGAATPLAGAADA